MKKKIKKTEMVVKMPLVDKKPLTRKRFGSKKRPKMNYGWIEKTI